MFTTFSTDADDNLLAEITNIAYQAVLRQGLTRPFLEVELELWSEIRRAFVANASLAAEASAY